MAPQLKPAVLGFSSIGAGFFDKSKVGKDDTGRALAASLFWLSVDSEAPAGIVNVKVGNALDGIARAASRGLTTFGVGRSTFMGDGVGCAAIGGVGEGGKDDSGWKT